MSIRDRAREAGFFDRLRRHPKRGWVAGVCAGLAEFFDWNVKLIRLVFVAAFIISGFFPVGVIYLALWYLMDEDAPPPHRGDVGGHAASTPGQAAPTPAELRLRLRRLEERLRNMEACVTSDEFELRRELKKLEG
ncbi:PspC domain-containing protein [Sinimarinibacterium thermocellulolyticum]|uniref:PspC domain-containing protein n=1 Tax=Sinimarinibacterium thermocellulolyticum TaxID=3170016 RepID=A0ABV2AAI1_9GAMM